MKIFKLFPLACAALMMSACSSDDPSNGGSTGVNEPQYLSVNIVNVGATPSRASGDYENGSADENKINKVRFYFFNGDGSPYLIKATGTEVTGGENINWLEATPGEDTTTPGTSTSVEKITNAVLVINGVQNAAPAAIVAVVNPETVDATTLKNGGTMRLSELRNTAVGQNFYKKDASTGAVSEFVMSNSVYVNAGEDVCASLVAGHVTTSPETAKAKPVDLYVERVVAKVTADVDPNAFEKGDGSKWDATKYGTKKAVGKIGDNEVYAVIEGWGLASENGKAEIEKQVDKGWSDGNLGFLTPWTTSDYHRCFWERSVAFDAGISGNLPVNPTFNQLKAKMQDVLYTLPNTPTGVTNLKDNDLTKLAVAATLKYKDADGNWHEADICRYNGVQFLGVDNLKKQVALTFSQYYTSTDATHYTQLSASDIDFKDPDGTMQQYRVTPTLANDPAGTKKYYTKTTTGTTPTFTEVNKSIVLAAIEASKAEIRKGGRAYYFVPIKHLGKTGEVAEYGIVRNHFYKITLSGIKGFGTPVYNPDQVVKPVVPTYDDTYLAARVQVLQWRIVNQNASLGE